MPPSPLPPRKPLFPPDPPPRRRNTKLAIYLAIGIALVFIPLTLQYQNNRFRDLRSKREAAHPTPTPPPKTIEETGDQSVPAERRLWHMYGVDGITGTQAEMRFGKPLLTRDYNVTYGAFLGPQFGLKHYFLSTSPGFDQREKDSPVVWKFPQYTTIREVIFKMRESYLTLWLHEPRVEVDLRGDDADALFPRTAAGEWVVIDHYRVGQDLVKNPPVAAAPTPGP